ncbi:MAG: DUF4136 domain-containing protein [Rubrivivax sp.]|nr:DUF4136 domain-containing protein [Rubrivivax sp.]
MNLIHRRTACGLLTAAAATLVLGGCAALTSVSSEVSSFGEWPADRKPGTYAFERLPSQQARAAETEQLEAAARSALAKAGFTQVAAGQEPNVLVQVGARVGRSDYSSPWADPIWWRGSFGYYRHGPWSGPRWGTGLGLGLNYEPQRYEREIAVLIRDRASGKPLYESRASNESISSSAAAETLSAMFGAALMDFPRLGMNPRRVVVPLTKTGA